MTDLDSVMKKSLAQASSHSREVYGKNPLTAKEVLDLANSSALITAATTRPDGRPHLSPVDLVAVDGTLYVGVDKTTARYKNLIQNPAMTVMISEGWKQQAILEGVAHFLDIRSETLTKVLEAEKRKYGWTTEAVAELSPVRIFTWKAK
jgi:F420H(2)-dependent biliverdin reductase